MENQKPAFFVFDTKITDGDALAPYLAKAEATYQAFGGQMMVLGGELEVVEGNAPQGIIVILQFDSMKTAKAWYESENYQAILPHRLAGSQTNSWLAEGLATS